MSAISVILRDDAIGGFLIDASHLKSTYRVEIFIFKIKCNSLDNLLKKKLKFKFNCDRDIILTLKPPFYLELKINKT